jgi:hypothetical protein
LKDKDATYFGVLMEKSDKGSEGIKGRKEWDER